jgi:outer membrane protein
MKKFLILLVLSFCVLQQTYSQKFGYMDLDFITSKMPEYKKAQDEINQFSEKWAKDIQDKFAEVDKMQRAYMAEEVLLTEELKRKRQNDIKAKELEAREYNNKVFGTDGLLFQKKKDLIKPILEKIQRSVDKVAVQRKIDLLFDKSSNTSLIYTNPIHDCTDYILEDLGIELKPAAAPTAPSINSGSAPAASKPTNATQKANSGAQPAAKTGSSGKASSTTRKPK